MHRSFRFVKKCFVLSFVFLLNSLIFSFAATPLFPIQDTGKDFPINYDKYGEFRSRGSNEYAYKITNREGLARVMGTGLFPNAISLSMDPAYQAWKKKKGGGLHWDHVQTGDPQSDFYVWADAKDVAPGTKLYFTAQALAEAGHLKQALKAYYAILIHFPREACWAADRSFVWYVAAAALDQIESITQQHPELGVRLKGAVFKVTHGNDTNLTNDVFVIDPGQWVKGPLEKLSDLKRLKVINQRGYGKVRLVQFENKHWQLQVNGKPLVVRAVTYLPTPIGQHLSAWGNRWMFEDSNENGKPDAPYDTWVDENRNGQQDENEPVVGDFELLRQMGVNAIRVVRHSKSLEYDPSEFNKQLLRDLHANYGIYAIMEDYIGAYTLGSGASWEEGTDYTDPVQLENMRQLVKALVMDHRSEPYVLMWVLGNENLMPSGYTGINATRTNAADKVEAYLKFVNELAEMIHKLDPDHPVGVGNWELEKLEEHGLYAPQLDIFGANSYRGATGFGRLWKNVQEKFDRPVLITEYGCDAYDSRKEAENERAQATYHEGNWKDIQVHLAGGSAEGNAIGGRVFEFLDEWWKSPKGSWDSHDSDKDGPMAHPDGWTCDEWYGLISLGDGQNDPFLRQPRKTYYLYRDKLWKDSKTSQ